MRPISTVFLLLFLYSINFACQCPPTYDELEYQFIALVQICGNEAVYENGKKVGLYQSNFDILELYKGPRLQHIFVHSDYPGITGGISSCDIYLKVGAEVLIYAKYSPHQHHFVTGLCSPTRTYRGVNGVRGWSKNSTHTRLNDLRKHYLNLEPANVRHDSLIYYYSNRQIEAIERYNDGLLHGRTDRYYPDGKPYYTEHYKHGKKHGVHEKYGIKGGLWRKANYIADQLHGEYWYYYTKERLHFYRVYHHGKLIENQKFDYKTQLIERREYRDYEVCLIYYENYENGELVKKYTKPLY